MAIKGNKSPQVHTEGPPFLHTEEFQEVDSLYHKDIQIRSSSS